MSENMGGPEGPVTPNTQPDPMGLGTTSTGMAPNVAAGCSYIMHWVTGLIFFLMEKENKFVRFHAMQSICLGALAAILGFVYMFMFVGAAATSAASSTAGGGSMALVAMIFMVVWLAFFVLWVVCLIQAFTGKWFKIPVIGDLAMKWSGAGQAA